MYISPKEDSFTRLCEAGLVPADGPLRLHLGCGEIRLDGYVNIDFDNSAHSVQQRPAADIFGDVTKLNFPGGTVDQIRLHHVFEHFDRPTALGLLCRWHRFLKVGGQLVIETPDLTESMLLLQSPAYTYQQKQVVVRHLFGSHEAGWAVHWDGWYREKYEHVLSQLGYQIVAIHSSQWQMTRNVTVIAQKVSNASVEVLKRAATEILVESCVDNSEGEQRLLEVWTRALEEVIDHAPEGKISHIPSMSVEQIVTRIEPVVAIFMPVFNRERYLGETLDSLLKQTYTDFELIIVDDGSTDSSVRIAQEYAARDGRIRVLESAHKGEVAARNEALRHLSPSVRYLMNHDSDDLSHPRKLEILVRHLEAHPETDIVGCYAEYFDDSGKFLGFPALHCGAAQIRAHFREVNSMVNSAALIRRAVFERLGGYREEFRSVDDYDFFARALRGSGHLENLPQTLHRIRLHGGSISATKAEQQQRLAERIIAEIPREFSVGQGTNSFLFTCPDYFEPGRLSIRGLAESLATMGHHVVVAVSTAAAEQMESQAGAHIVGFDVQGAIAGGVSGPDAERYQAFLRSYPAEVMVNVGLGIWSTDLAFLPLASSRRNAMNILIPGEDGFSDVGSRYPLHRGDYDELFSKILPLYDAVIHSGSTAGSMTDAARYIGVNNLILPIGAGSDRDSGEFEACLRALRQRREVPQAPGHR